MRKVNKLEQRERDVMGIKVLVIHHRTIRKSLGQHRGNVHIKDVTLKGYMGGECL